MAELKRRKLGGRRFLREMPWYVIIGPPAAGKTTALRQSGLEFPFDLTDDLHGVGGTRNCDWFFTEDGGADRHRRPLRAAGEPARGRRRRVARLPRPPEEAPRPPGAQRRHRRDPGRHPRRGRRRDPRPRPRDPQAPGRARPAARDPPAGLPAGHQGRPRSRASSRASTASPTAEREQVWGATFAPGETRRRRRGRPRARGAGRSGSRAASAPRMEGEEELATRAEIFRFPAQVASLEAPLAPPRRHRLRREPLRGERLAARLLPDLGHPGGHADRPAGRRARLGLRPAGRAAPTPRRGSSGAASSCAGS